MRLEVNSLTSLRLSEGRSNLTSFFKCANMRSCSGVNRNSYHLQKCTLQQGAPVQLAKDEYPNHISNTAQPQAALSRPTTSNRQEGYRMTQ